MRHFGELPEHPYVSVKYILSRLRLLIQVKIEMSTNVHCHCLFLRSFRELGNIHARSQTTPIFKSRSLK